LRVIHFDVLYPFTQNRINAFVRFSPGKRCGFDQNGKLSTISMAFGNLHLQRTTPPLKLVVLVHGAHFWHTLAHTNTCSQTRGSCSRHAHLLVRLHGAHLLTHTNLDLIFLCSLIQLYLLLHAAVRSGSGGDAGGERCGALSEPHWRGRLAILSMRVSYIFSYFCSY